MRTLLLVMIALTAATASRAGETTPLFSALDPIEITIAGPINEIARKASSSTDPRPAKLTYGAEEHAIDLAARGNARRRPETCKFPPLRVTFTAKPAKESLFHKQKSLKLVTHCRPAASFQKHTLLEYAAYRMYNAVTEESFRVRLANVRYVDSGGKLVAERAGFFIEDADDLASRVGMKEVNPGNLTIAQHNAPAAARAALFFHLIANHDWSMLAGPDGECCHNGKLLGAEKAAASELVYAPYDFDYSGFVDAPYAVPPDGLGINSVRTRLYRGSCALNVAVDQEAAQYRARRGAIEEAVRSTPGLDARAADKAVAFLGGFFDDIADETSLRKMLKRCR